MRGWDEWPEPLRWVLFLPALALLIALFGLLLTVLNHLRGEGGWAVAEIGAAFFVSMAFFPLTFALAPRGQILIGWIFYVLIMLVFSLSLLLSVGRGLGIAGLLPMLPPPPGMTWERRDWIELGQTAAWLIGATISFRTSAKKHREEKAKMLNK